MKTRSQRIIEYPWHGFRFDIVTGKCVSGQTCSLAPAPQILIDALNCNVIVEWKADTSQT